MIEIPFAGRGRSINGMRGKCFCDGLGSVWITIWGGGGSAFVVKEHDGYMGYTEWQGIHMNNYDVG